MTRKTENPWKILSSRIVYKSPFLKVVEDKVITPEGREGIHNLVCGGRGCIGGVTVAAVNNAREVYLVKQYRYAYGDYTLELPNGGIDRGESQLEAAKSELFEEAHLTAKEWVLLGNYSKGTESIKLVDYIFLARNLTDSETTIKNENNMVSLKLPLLDAVELAMSGKIPLAESALGIMLVEKYLEDEKNRY